MPPRLWRSQAGLFLFLVALLLLFIPRLPSDTPTERSEIPCESRGYLSPSAYAPAPGQAIPCVLVNQWFLHREPIYSVIFDVFDAEDVIEDHLDRVLRLTRGLFEVILVLDFCRDGTLSVVHRIIDLWTAECFRGRCPNRDLVRILLIEQRTPVWETTANNIGMRGALGRYWILLQDDMRMEVAGWNTLLALPLQRWTDLFAVSGRCAHARAGRDHAGRCGEDVRRPLVAEIPVRCAFHIRDTVNRGPYVVEAHKMKLLGYFDEHNFHMENDDHDANARALARGWKSGWMPLDWSQVKPKRRPRAETAEEFAFTTFRKARSNGGFLRHGKALRAYETRPFPECIQANASEGWWKGSLTI
jgi:hypothetical protein